MSRYHRDLYISWEEFHRDTRALCGQLLERGPTPSGIIAVSRGGLIPAAIVARELDIRLVDTVCVSSYHGSQAQQQSDEVEVFKTASGTGADMVLIDDLVDTGRTARAIRALLPDAYFATVYAKPEGRPLTDLCVREVGQETWIRFPWDTALQFTAPIAAQR